jgi:hypothetical protein
MLNMKKFNSKGFSGLEGLLLLVVVGLIGFIGWYVYSSGNKQKVTNETTNQTAKEESKTKEELTWKRIDSGKKGFSVQLPDGWGEVLRPLDSDLLTIRGTKQPQYQEGKEVVIKDLEGFGTDGPGVFTILIHDNIAEPRGVATDFSVGDLKGKKYTYVAEKDSERGLGEEDKGDKRYDYRFQLKDGKQLAIFYNVYANTDDKDQITTVDKIVGSIKLQ